MGVSWLREAVMLDRAHLEQCIPHDWRLVREDFWAFWEQSSRSLFYASPWKGEQASRQKVCRFSRRRARLVFRLYAAIEARVSTVGILPGYKPEPSRDANSLQVANPTLYEL